MLRTLLFAYLFARCIIRFRSIAEAERALQSEFFLNDAINWGSCGNAVLTTCFSTHPLFAHLVHTRALLSAQPSFIFEPPSRGDEAKSSFRPSLEGPDHFKSSSADHIMDVPKQELRTKSYD